MTDRQLSSEELVADYIRSSMRVELPDGLTDEVMRSVAAAPQARRSWFSALPPYAPALAAAVATALIIVVGLFLVAPRTIGPPPAPTPTPAPTLSPEGARVLAEPGDVIRIPALDGQGQFGTITIERGAEKAGYEGFVPVAFGDVFFVEVYVKYEPERSTDEEYGEWEFAFAADANGNGFDDADILTLGVGFLGMEGQPGYESAPQPLLDGKRSGDDVLEGWLVIEIPAASADYDLHLVYGHGEWTDGIENMVPDSSALLRRPGEPVGVSAFDPDAFPEGSGSPVPMPSFYALPSPAPSPAATFEPVADAEADALFEETQVCTNAELAVAVTFPASWYTNEAFEELPACNLFGPEPIDAELVFNGLAEPPPITVLARPEFFGGIEQPMVERIPIGDRIAWRVSFSEDQMSYGTSYLLPVGGDPYGPFLWSTALTDETVPVLERMLTRLQFDE